MLSLIFLAILGCGTMKKNSTTTNTIKASMNDSMQLIEFQGVKNIILVDKNGVRFEAHEASEGLYEAFAVVELTDSQGTRDEEIRLEKITLNAHYTLKMDCAWKIMDNANAELFCDVDKILKESE